MPYNSSLDAYLSQKTQPMTIETKSSDRAEARRYPPRAPNLSQIHEFKQSTAVALFHSGKTRREIATLLSLPEAAVTAIIDRDTTPDTITYQPINQPNRTNYENHDELSRHYAGAEFEDTRKLSDRGKDWPPRGWHPAIPD